jgi:hypothetical protein
MTLLGRKESKFNKCKLSHNRLKSSLKMFLEPIFSRKLAVIKVLKVGMESNRSQKSTIFNRQFKLLIINIIEFYLHKRYLILWIMWLRAFRHVKVSKKYKIIIVKSEWISILQELQFSKVRSHLSTISQLSSHRETTRVKAFNRNHRIRIFKAVLNQILRKQTYTSLRINYKTKIIKLINLWNTIKNRSISNPEILWKAVKYWTNLRI